MRRLFTMKSVKTAALLLSMVSLLSSNRTTAQVHVVSYPTAGLGQTFMVPAGVTSIQVKAWGSAGAAYNSDDISYPNTGGAGGFARATLTVTPGETLTVDVGGSGVGKAGGINGGGSSSGEAGGGGMTDIKRDTTYLVIAGGGGGSGNGQGGNGGGLQGTASSVCQVGGVGGSQTMGGIDQTCSGMPATNGTQYQGGQGENGGGGGGYYGGGGGSCGCGAGGGSGYVIPGATNDTMMTAPLGNIGVPPDTADPDYNGTAGYGITVTSGITLPGNPGLLVIIYGGPELNGNPHPCAGVPTTYNTNAGQTNYTWKITGAGTLTSGGSANDSTATVTWTGPGTITVGYTSVGVTTTDSITVGSLPVAGTVTGSTDTICAGESVQLSDIGSSGNIQWQRMLSDSFMNIPGAQSSIYNTPGIIQTTYFRVMASNSCGADSSNAWMVFVIPVPVAGIISATPDTVCQGAGTRLLSTGASGHVLQWQSSVGASIFANISDGDSSTYTTPLLSQTTAYRLLATNGVCADTSAPITVTVNPVPVAPVLSVADSAICPSDSTLISTTGNYTSYLWNMGGNSDSVYATEAGAYEVTVTGANGCTAVSMPQQITEYPAPQMPVIALKDDTLSVMNYSSYQWLYNNDSIPGAISNIYVAQQSGNYAVLVSDSNGCKELSNNTPVTVDGISDMGAGNLLSIYPDPFTNTLYIASNSSNSDIERVAIYDVAGRVMASKHIDNISVYPIAVDLSQLPDGTYYVEVIKRGTANYCRQVVKISGNAR